jgi:hypothetical protein
MLEVVLTGAQKNAVSGNPLEQNLKLALHNELVA